MAVSHTAMAMPHTPNGVPNTPGPCHFVTYMGRV